MKVIDFLAHKTKRDTSDAESRAKEVAFYAGVTDKVCEDIDYLPKEWVLKVMTRCRRRLKEMA